MTKKWAYYNDNEPYVCEWMRNLIIADLIPDGEVDERDLWDVAPNDIRHFAQVHVCAGIAVWAHALREAGFPDDREVWSGSMPCQPYSSAGQGLGFADERHLWPAWYYLIEECRPPLIVGEQVSSKGGLEWLDLVHTDMETAGYAFAAIDTCAAGADAPHIRQRLYWAALANAAGRGCGVVGGEAFPRRGGHVDGGEPAGGLGDAVQPESPDAEPALVRGAGWWEEGGAVEQPGGSFWSGAAWIPCRDGKYRPVESRVEPLADGLARELGYVRAEDGSWQLSPLVEKNQTYGRTGRLRGYGNAINSPAAVEWIRCVMECAP